MQKLSSEDKTIHDQFTDYGRNAKEWMKKCVFLLPKIEQREIWAKKGFPNIYEYARKLAGMSRNKVNESLRILKITDGFPEIIKVIKQKGIFAVKPVVNLLTKETELFWAQRTLEMKKSTLETFVKDYKKEHKSAHSSDHHDSDHASDRPGAGSPQNNGSNKPNLFQDGKFEVHEKTAPKIQLSMKLGTETFNELKKIKDIEDWDDAMKKILKYYQKGIEAEEKQLQEQLNKEKPSPVTSKSRTIPTAIKNYVKTRSHNICEHPNCKKPGKHIHHTEPFSIRKIHDPDKLLFLCEEHHQIIHLGYIDDDIESSSSGRHAQKLEIKPQIFWQQINKLPDYDLKNMINTQVASFRQF